MQWRRHKRVFVILGVIFFLLAIPRVMFPDLDHGDEASDANVLNAGQNFVRFGFLKTHFLPLFEPQADFPEGLYTHYPPLPDITNGLLRSVFKTEALWFFRAMSLLCALFNVIFWYLFIYRFTKSMEIACLASLFYLTDSDSTLAASLLTDFTPLNFIKSCAFG